MRTKTIENVIDRGFWALLLVMPILAYLIINHHGSSDFISVLSQFNINDTNIVYTGLVTIFGSDGYLPFVDTSSTNVLLLYMSYFVCLELVHIFVDVVLFVPKVCVNLLDKYSQMGKI